MILLSNHSGRQIYIVGLSLILVFLIFVLRYDHYYRDRMHKEAQNHSEVIEQSLWDLYPEPVTKYFEQIIRKMQYKKVTIRDSENVFFLQLEGEESNQFEETMIAIGLIRVETVYLRIYHKDDLIGSLEIEYLNTTIYLYLNVLLILALVYGIYILLLKAWINKNLLEARVQQRTQELVGMMGQLKGEEEKYKALFAHANDAILLLQSDQIVECNEKACEMFRGSREMIFHKTFLELSESFQQNGVSSNTLFHKYLSDIADGSVERIEWLNKRLDGVVFETEITANDFILKGKKYSQYIIRDMSQSRMIEKQLRHSEKMQAIGQLANGIAHDFNNVLSGILGCTSVIQKTKLEANAEKFLQLMIDAIHRATTLTNRLLSFSRVNAEAQFSVIRVSELLSTATTLLSYTIGKNIKINVINQADDDQILGDTSALESVFLNMGINAAQAMPQGGVLQFTLQKKYLNSSFENPFEITVEEGNYLEIEVKDSGAGIQPENLERIFEPFFTTKEAGKGTGLGLASVLKVVRSHKGVIKVESTINVGTAFKIYLPCCVKKEENQVISKVEVEKEQRTVLLIADTELNRMLAQGSLEDIGYAVVGIADLNDAMSKLEEGHDKAVISVFDTQEVTEEMHALCQHLAAQPNAKILIAAARIRENEFAYLANKDIIRFLLKPYTNDDLDGKLKELFKPL